MKLLLLGPRISNLQDIRNFSGVWSYYLEREFLKMGVTLQWEPQLRVAELDSKAIIQHYSNLDLTGIDHVLALGTAYFTKIPTICAKTLMQKVGGAVTQLHDRPIYLPTVNCTFTIRKDVQGNLRNQSIGWAADPKLCQPLQDAGTLRILIDHSYYYPTKPVASDRTMEIVEKTLAFAATKPPKFTNVKIRRILDGGVVDCTKVERSVFHRVHIPYPDICKEYCKTDIFMVTHPESVGLSALEAATAGALVVTPTGYIAKDLLGSIRAITYGAEIPWPQVLTKLDINESRQMAVRNNWLTVAMKIIGWLERFKK